MSWNTSIEELIQKIGEQSQCFAILHRNSQKYYSYLSHFINIPVIILSTVCGSANFIVKDDSMGTNVIGGISILTGIIQTIGTYFKWGQLSESHKVSYISYQKLFNVISAELALPQEHRKEAEIMLDDIRQQIERLQELAPPIPQNIIEDFKKQYSQYENVSRPTITNGLEKVNIYKPEIIVSEPKPIKIDIEKPKPIFKI